MSENILLTFRWGNAEYGISLADVSGVTSNTLAALTPEAEQGDFAALQKPLLLFALETGSAMENRQAILIQTNRVPVALLVDQVMGVKKRDNPLEEESGEPITFQIWQLPKEKER